MQHLLNVLDNGSVSAFLGAFFAYLLVLATDQRRSRKRVSTLSAEMELNIALATKKLETLRGLRDDLRTNQKVSSAQILKFNVAQIRILSSEVVSELSLVQRECIEALCYTMEATDDLIAEAQSLASKFHSPQVPAAISMGLPQLLDDYQNSVANLRRFQEMAALYVAGKYAELVSKTYGPADYIE